MKVQDAYRSGWLFVWFEGQLEKEKTRNSYAMFFINHRSLNKVWKRRLQWFVSAITVNIFKTARCIFDDVYDNSCLFKWYLFIRFVCSRDLFIFFMKKDHFSRICWYKRLSSLHSLSAEWWKSSAPNIYAFAPSHNKIICFLWLIFGLNIMSKRTKWTHTCQRDYFEKAGYELH